MFECHDVVVVVIVIDVVFIVVITITVSLSFFAVNLMKKEERKKSIILFEIKSFK